MEPFRYLPHTADAKFRAFGSSLEEAFKNAGIAMTNLVTDTSKIRKFSKRALFLQSTSLENLIIKFLEELLYLAEVKGFVMGDAKLEISGFDLKGTLFGDFLKNYETHGHVKAVTYNELLVSKENDIFIIQIVVDV